MSAPAVPPQEGRPPAREPPAPPPVPWLLRYLDDEDMRKVVEFRYASAGSTWLDGCMNPFWEALARRVPYPLAPNMLTLLGFLSGLVAALWLGIAPSVAHGQYLGAGVLLFLYQTLDAIDGKVARARGFSSPIGALLDHGLDALMIVLFTSITGFAMDKDLILAPTLHPFSLLGYSLVPAAWFCAQVDQALTGVMDTRGITEGEFLIIGLCLFSELVGGPPLWRTEVTAAPLLQALTLSSGPVPLSRLVLLGLITIASSALLGFVVHSVFVAARSAESSPGLAALLAAWRWVKALSPLVINASCHALCAAAASTSSAPWLFAGLGFGLNGLTFGAIALRVILSSQFCGRGLPSYPWLQLLPCCIGAVAVHLVPPGLRVPTLATALLWQLASLVLVFSGVCLQVSRELGVPILTVPPRASKKE